MTTTNPTAGNGGPDGTVVINGNATYTNSTTVTLTLAKSGGGPNPATMKFSNDNSTWLGPFALATVVHVDDPDRRRHEDRVRALLQLQRTVRRDRERHDHARHDRARAPRPRSHKISTTISGANTTVNLGWTAPVGVTDLGGYRMYKRLITSTGAWTLVCDTSSTTCSDTHKKTDTYEYYVVAYDLATNVSAELCDAEPDGLTARPGSPWSSWWSRWR